MNVILPIGSVVKVRDFNIPLMIFGYMQASAVDPNSVMDYVGVPFPTGNIDLAHQMGFQMHDITEVLFEGYLTDDFKPMKMLLEVQKTIREAKAAEAEG